MIRLLDLTISILGMILFLPAFLLFAALIVADSSGSVFYLQKRVGRGGQEFTLYKLRTMRSGADKNGLLTIGANDSRITKFGLFLRRYKIDEVPQLINVFKGDMSLVGPRPEVRRYVEHYTEDQKKILLIRPGVTDMASIFYKDENDVLSLASDPDSLYIKEILPHKISLNQFYIENPSVRNYFYIIYLTLRKLLSRSGGKGTSRGATIH
ncbi:MAG: sugar transferase [Imperialibacter sp.]|uniref:sugar transferase n=1 Tax=Imperialibacter sp. TaxID=2038411 RepID=UPI0032EEBA2D